MEKISAEDCVTGTYETNARGELLLTDLSNASYKCFVPMCGAPLQTTRKDQLVKHLEQRHDMAKGQIPEFPLFKVKCHSCGAYLGANKKKVDRHQDTVKCKTMSVKIKKELEKQTESEESDDHDSNPSVAMKKDIDERLDEMKREFNKVQETITELVEEESETVELRSENIKMTNELGQVKQKLSKVYTTNVDLQIKVNNQKQTIKDANSELIKKEKELDQANQKITNLENDFNDLQVSSYKTLDFAEISNQVEIGAGSYGTVYTVNYRGKELVLKSQDVDNGSLRELDIMKKLDHVNIMKIESINFETFSDHLQKAPKIIFGMEKMDCDLHDYLYGQKLSDFNLKKDWRDTISSGTVMGAAYLDEKNIIHGDLKPANILVNVKDLVIKITDFGHASEGVSAQGVTGTPGYMAPELVGNRGRHPYTKKVDAWALGATLYEVFNQKYLVSDQTDRREALNPTLQWKSYVTRDQRLAIESLLIKDVEDRKTSLDILDIFKQ